MRVAVTGSSGMLGGYVVAELRAAGYDVRQVDSRLPSGLLDSFVQADITDLGQMCGAFSGCEALVHLAAIPSLHARLPDVVFTNNVLGAFNALEAAALLGIRNVVAVSSGSALGVAYAYRHPLPLRYLPVDEAHPLLPQDAYGLSKQVGEQICAAFHHRTGGRAVSLRFPLIWDAQRAPDLLEQFAGADEQGRHTLWTYIEARDAALACRLALEAPGLTSEAFYVNAPISCARHPSDELARRFFPDAEIRGEAGGFWALCDGSRAEQALGFAARHRWRPS